MSLDHSLVGTPNPDRIVTDIQVDGHYFYCSSMLITSIVIPDPVGSGTFPWILIRNNLFLIRIRKKIKEQIGTVPVCNYNFIYFFALIVQKKSVDYAFKT